MSQDELERIKRVSDLLVSAHSVLRDQYAHRAFLIDIAIFGATLWLTAMAFVDPKIGVELTPFGLTKDLWLGLLSVVAFFLSIVQMRVDWKGKEYAHANACEAYASVKRGAVILLAQEVIDSTEYRKVLDSYESAGSMSIPVPEAKFNKLKQMHKIKVEISRHLDNKPGASPMLFRFKLWWRDNIGWCNGKS